MNETFRPSRGTLGLGLTAVVMGLAMAIGAGSAFFLDDPAAHGFNGRHSVLIVGSMGLVAGGAFALAGVYFCLVWRLERIVLSGNSIDVRTVFHAWQFEASDVDRLIWKCASNGGGFEIRARGQRAKVSFDPYSSADRLRMIRSLHRILPAARQENWPQFVHKVALPLRSRLTPLSTGPLEAGEVFITRRRYDRAAAVAIPIALFVAAAFWRLTGNPKVFALPVPLVLLWLLVRYSSPPEGRRGKRIAAQAGGREIAYCLAMLVVVRLSVVAVRFADVDRDTACSVGMALMVPTAPLFIYFLHRGGKEMRRQDGIAAADAPERWEHGELGLPGG